MKKRNQRKENCDQKEEKKGVNGNRFGEREIRT